MTKLTLKQKKFADEYIISGNIEKSALNAGYSENYARKQSHKLLANVGIKFYIDERLKELEKDKIATQDEVLQYLTSIMRGEQTEQVMIGVGNGIQSMTYIEVGAKDRIKAAEFLGNLHEKRARQSLQDELTKIKIEREKQSLLTNTTTEDKLSDLFDKIDGDLYGTD